RPRSVAATAPGSGVWPDLRALQPAGRPRPRPARSPRERRSWRFSLLVAAAQRGPRLRRQPADRPRPDPQRPARLRRVLIQILGEDQGGPLSGRKLEQPAGQVVSVLD